MASSHVILLINFIAIVLQISMAYSIAQASVATNSSAVSASNPGSSKKQIEFNYRLSGESRNNEIGNEKNIFGVDLTGTYKEFFSPSLMAKIQAGVKLESGREETLSADNDQFNEIYLEEASLHWKVLPWLRLRGGAINQGYIEMPLLVDSRAFPAVQQKLMYKSNNWYLGLTLQQAIPTSQSFSTKVVEDEQTPYFITETITAKWKAHPNVLLKAQGTYFAFYNLPSVVAEESGRFGNVIDEISVNQSAFRYPFQGFHVGAELQWRRTGGRNIKISSNYLENSFSESADNTSFFNKIEWPVAIGASEWIVAVEQFESGATASPAFYNNYIYGHNNRQGYAVGLGFDLKDPQFQMAIKYVDSQVIETSSTQYDETTVLITAGVLNDLF